VASSNSGGIDSATISKLPKLKVISHFGVGYDTVDVDAARKRGIAVTNTPDVLTEEVADLAMGLLYATVRRIPQGDRYVREGKWLKGAMALTESLQGKTLGIVGMGRIGQAIARRAEAANMKIAYQGPRRKADLPYAYHADAVSLAKGDGPADGGVPRWRGHARPGEPRRHRGTRTEGLHREHRARLGHRRAGASRGAAAEPHRRRRPRRVRRRAACPRSILRPREHGAATARGERHAPDARGHGPARLDNLAAHFAGKPLLTPV
jgi:hypothetical protein